MSLLTWTCRWETAEIGTILGEDYAVFFQKGTAEIYTAISSFEYHVKKNVSCFSCYKGFCKHFANRMHHSQSRYLENSSSKLYLIKNYCNSYNILAMIARVNKYLNISERLKFNVKRYYRAYHCYFGRSLIVLRNTIFTPHFRYTSKQGKFWQPW